MFQPGEIVIAAFPFSSLAGVKRRPCVVLAAGDTVNDFVVAFITTSTLAAKLGSAIVIDPLIPLGNRRASKHSRSSGQTNW